MKIIKNPEQLSLLLARERSRGKTIGFVPTMGALHEGHLSLVRAAKRENDLVVVSIFVNPTQFGPREDLKKYPRVFKQDSRLLKKGGADYLFYPSVKAMYPEGLDRPLVIRGATWPQIARNLCGKFRPGHFQGVVTVVSKLLGITGDCRLYLGAKDYQQAAVLTRMVRDLGLKVRVRMMPTVREKDGLAMSSRNRYLLPRERARALAISKTLKGIKREIRAGKVPIGVLKAKYRKALERSVDRIQYLEIVDAETLRPAVSRRAHLVALAACFVGKTRLIDNVIIQPRRQ
ncbi:MAG TPA: pantoate--beta-alanine ligase [Candidatus Omnitrophota bacterium]|jgi:pantoate--beta-alanine ligase|nr:MAG: Pantothenate synthetase [Candidatus Omnitrophica bacterium ADurb.Bin314]HOE69155.1 pantoate--beta-alanine ligase [Candidatus Omnitrophota bacterium]HQB93915.1 pantoate--beta-alanine ligase [Candidatus Omnitrophota bacterium]